MTPFYRERARAGRMIRDTRHYNETLFRRTHASSPCVVCRRRNERERRKRIAPARHGRCSTFGRMPDDFAFKNKSESRALLRVANGKKTVGERTKRPTRPRQDCAIPVVRYVRLCRYICAYELQVISDDFRTEGNLPNPVTDFSL